MGMQKLIGITIVVIGLFMSQIKRKQQNGNEKVVVIHRK